jgi:hypothetical protein
VRRGVPAAGGTDIGFNAAGGADFAFNVRDAGDPCYAPAFGTLSGARTAAG